MLRDIIDNLAQLIIVLLISYLIAIFSAIMFNCFYQRIKDIQKSDEEDKLGLYFTDTIKVFLPVEKGINWEEKIDKIYNLGVYDVIKYKHYGKDKKYNYYEVWLLYKYQ